MIFMPRIKEINKYKRMRLDLGITQVKMAKLLGVCQGTICHWETGRSIPCDRLMKKIEKLMNK